MLSLPIGSVFMAVGVSVLREKKQKKEKRENILIRRKTRKF